LKGIKQKSSGNLGRGAFCSRFENNLLGLKEKEEKKFSLVFPDDFQIKTWPVRS